MRTPHPAEFITRIEPQESAVLYAIQHKEGFAAHCNGVEFQEFRPAAWCDGWIDAAELGAFAPIEFFRMSAEI